MKMVDKYGILEDVKPLMVNVAANLQTIDRQKIVSKSGELDEEFTAINQQIQQKENEIKNMIIKKYSVIQQLSSKNPGDDPLRKEEAILSPLSKLMSDVLD